MNDFAPGLLTTVDMLSRWVTAELLFQLCHAPYLERLRSGDEPAAFARDFGLDPDLFEVYLCSLQREGIVETDGKRVRLSELGSRYCRYAGWITLFVGGYGTLFRNVDAILRGTHRGARRDAGWVGIGSCLMSQFDSIPLTGALIERVRPDAALVLDYGCGNALSIVTLCERNPRLRAIGVEESAVACEAARRLVAERGLDDRVSVVNADVLSYEPTCTPDIVVFAFVLQELAGQSGEAELIGFLSKLGRSFPRSHVVVIEVDDVSKTDPGVFETPMGRGFYNYYFMLHPFTDQRLLPDAAWRRIFAEAGFTVVAREVVDRDIDPSGLEVGYVLEPAGRA
jgi:2-ketoarginine methyltransferase